MKDDSDFHKIHYRKEVKDYLGRNTIELIIQYRKIIIQPVGSKGSMLMFSLRESSMLQFKGMYSYSSDIYRHKRDEYMNWMLLNTTKYSIAKKMAGSTSASRKAKEEDYIIKLLTPLEALVINRILTMLNET